MSTDTKEKKRKYYTAILTGMLKGTCVPIQEEMHFVKAVNDKEALKEVKELVKEKERQDSSYGWWNIDVVKAPNGKIIYSH
jgi:hypothetical protein